MIIVDANLLVYAYSESFPQHKKAARWMLGEFRRGTRIGIPWESSLAFVRLLLNPRIVERPESPQALWKHVAYWLGFENVWVPGPGAHHADFLASLMPTANRSSLVPDAHLAAIAMQHGLVLMSCDGDFARFPGLRWKNPLAD